MSVGEPPPSEGSEGALLARGATPETDKALQSGATSPRQSGLTGPVLSTTTA